MSSTENEVTPVAAISCTVCTSPSGRRKPISDLALAQQRQIGLAGDVIRAVTQHLQDDVGRAKDFGALGRDSGAFGDVVGIGIAGFDASASFDDDFQSSFFEVGNDCGYEARPAAPPERSRGEHRPSCRTLHRTAQSGEHCILPAKVDLYRGSWDELRMRIQKETPEPVGAPGFQSDR